MIKEIITIFKDVILIVVGFCIGILIRCLEERISKNKKDNQ
jgi:hypothetical protein